MKVAVCNWELCVVAVHNCSCAHTVIAEHLGNDGCTVLVTAEVMLHSLQKHEEQ